MLSTIDATIRVLCLSKVELRRFLDLTPQARAMVFRTQYLALKEPNPRQDSEAANEQATLEDNRNVQASNRWSRMAEQDKEKVRDLLTENDTDPEVLEQLTSLYAQP